MALKIVGGKWKGCRIISNMVAAGMGASSEGKGMDLLGHLQALGWPLQGGAGGGPQN